LGDFWVNQPLCPLLDLPEPFLLDRGLIHSAFKHIFLQPLLFINDLVDHRVLVLPRLVNKRGDAFDRYIILVSCIF